MCDCVWLLWLYNLESLDDIHPPRDVVTAWCAPPWRPMDKCSNYLVTNHQTSELCAQHFNPVQKVRLFGNLCLGRRYQNKTCKPNLSFSFLLSFLLFLCSLLIIFEFLSYLIQYFSNFYYMTKVPGGHS